MCEYTVFAENHYERKYYIDFFGCSKKNENENNINTIPTAGTATSYYVTTFYSSFAPPPRVFKTARIIIYYTRTVPERDGNGRINVYIYVKTEKTRRSVHNGRRRAVRPAVFPRPMTYDVFWKPHAYVLNADGVVITAIWSTGSFVRSFRLREISSDVLPQRLKRSNFIPHT